MSSDMLVLLHSTLSWQEDYGDKLYSIHVSLTQLLGLAAARGAMLLRKVNVLRPEEGHEANQAGMQRLLGVLGRCWAGHPPAVPFVKKRVVWDAAWEDQDS
jgi:hypothetical protein